MPPTPAVPREEIALERQISPLPPVALGGLLVVPAGLIAAMIVSIGLSLTLRYIFQFFIGGGTTQLPFSTQEKLPLFGVVKMSFVDMASIAISIAVIVGLICRISSLNIFFGMVK